MAKAKSNVKSLSIPQKLARGDELVSDLTGNTELPPGVGDAIAAKIAAAGAELRANYQAQMDAKNSWIMAGNAQTASENKWDSAVSAGATSVDEASGGNEQIILSTGYKVADSTANTLPVPGKVMNVHLSAGDEPGHVDAAWNGQKDATGYAGQFWLGEDVTQATWGYAPPVRGKQSKLQLLGLPSGARVWFRVQATNTQVGPWSDPVSIIVP